MNIRLGGALLWAATAVSFCLVSPVLADHRSAPTIDAYSAIGTNDVFMFRDPSDSSKLVVALSTQAVADPMFGSSYHFQPNALYRLNFTTRSDARPTASIDLVFGPFGNGSACPTGPACQTYRAVFPNKVVAEGFTTQGTFGATHLAPVITTAGNIEIFAGPREDPFFFDLVGFNRSIAAGANKFTGVDAFLGKNINAIVLEFPVNMVFPANVCTGTISASGFTTPCGVWAVTYLGNFHTVDDAKFETHPEALRQVDRMGNRAINTLLIPAALKDLFNFGEPKSDSANFTGVILNQILTLDQKFGECPGATSAAACNPNVLLLASVAVPDTLKFALNLPDGFPNGRQPADRTTDVLISLILQIPNFTDGTSVKTYCSGFPFLGPPL